MDRFHYQLNKDTFKICFWPKKFQIFTDQSIIKQRPWQPRRSTWLPSKYRDLDNRQMKCALGAWICLRIRVVHMETRRPCCCLLICSSLVEDIECYHIWISNLLVYIASNKTKVDLWLESSLLWHWRNPIWLWYFVLFHFWNEQSKRLSTLLQQWICRELHGQLFLFWILIRGRWINYQRLLNISYRHW